uniref:Uncharacterized protein n=2 Tax=Tetranychus urticae TaxID=32264 RepID=T1KLQ3_TETUR
MLINDPVQAKDRFCRTTGCDSRTLQQVFAMCQRAYGSNTIRREPCDGGRARYRCCTASVPQERRCLLIGCSNESVASIEANCIGNFGANAIVTITPCGKGLLSAQCCIN